MTTEKLSDLKRTIDEAESLTSAALTWGHDLSTKAEMRDAEATFKIYEDVARILSRLIEKMPEAQELHEGLPNEIIDRREGMNDLRAEIINIITEGLE